jgi:hypothetical protein
MKPMSSVFASGVVFALVSIGANAQTDPGSATPADPINASAPSGTYTEAVVQVVFSDETDSEHPLTVTDLDNAAPQIHTFFTDLSYGKLNFQTNFIRVHLPVTWASYAICHYCGFNALMGDAINAAIALNSSFFAGANGVSVMVLSTYGAGNFTNFGLQTYPGISQQVLQSLLSEAPLSQVNPSW